ncbi:MAG TPA: hypothetical protein VHJ18_11430 [Streptosporangiaceae bacterium]|nr:hypothetical protein [Streptosporangiaceae bacterium]
MNRPTEQLIRDYLNRLSLAAKAGLEPGDRQALLDHTRARIDAECGGIANPTAEQVRRTLAGLGDPIALVEKERSRVAARRAWDEDGGSRAATGQLKQPASESRASGPQRQVWPPAATPTLVQRPLMPPVILPPATANTQGYAVRLTTTITPSAPAALAAQASQPVLAGSQVSAGSDISASSAPAGLPLPAGDDAPMRPVTASNGAWARPPISPSQVSADQEASAANGSSPAADEPADRSAPESDDSGGRSAPPPTSPSSPVCVAATPTSGSSPRDVPAEKEAGAPGEVPAEDNSEADHSEPAPTSGAGPGKPGYVRRTGLSARLRPRWPRSGAESTANAAVKPATERGPAHADQQQPVSAAESKPGEKDAPGIEPEPPAEPSRLQVIGAAGGRRLRRIGAALLTIAVRDRLEAMAVVSLGLGGAIYQPIWLIGAVMVMASKKWDLRDKWLGLALPVLAVLIGTALEITLGSPLSGYRAYLVEAWVAAGRLSRIAAVISALFLLWRVHKYQGRPTRRLPPWSPDRKPGR